MKLFSVAHKTLLEQMRDYWMLLMAIVTAPFFLFIYWAMLGGTSMVYPLLVINQDRSEVLANGSNECGKALVEILQNMKYANGDRLLRVDLATDRSLADKTLADWGAVALLVIPENFSAAIIRLKTSPAQAPKTAVTIAGDPNNPRYILAATLALTAVDEFVRKTTGSEPAIGWKEEFVGSKNARTEFETYVPGLIILSIILLLFTSAIAIVQEIEHQTMVRLRLTTASPFAILGGITLVQILIGLLSVGLTFVLARGMGFRSEGSLWLALLVCVLTICSLMGWGLLTACWCKTSGSVLTAGVFPFFLLMWFTGAAYPFPRMVLFCCGAQTVAVNDILPPTHAVIALNKIMSRGASLCEIGYELCALLVLTVFYFALGVAVFKKMHMKG